MTSYVRPYGRGIVHRLADDGRTRCGVRLTDATRPADSIEGTRSSLQGPLRACIRCEQAAEEEGR